MQIKKRRWALKVQSHCCPEHPRELPGASAYRQGIGISRKIEDEEERNRLKEIADEIKPEGMGLIIRTAARGADYARLKLDLDRLLEIWNEIERKAKSVKAPSLLFPMRS